MSTVSPATVMRSDSLSHGLIWLLRARSSFHLPGKFGAAKPFEASRAKPAQSRTSNHTYLEVQKLCWFLERTIRDLGVEDPLDLRFVADKYGPYSDRLRHLLNGLAGSYLHCAKRLSDAGPSDTIWFDEARRAYLELYLKQEDHRALQVVLDRTTALIDGFESPLGIIFRVSEEQRMVKVLHVWKT